MAKVEVEKIIVTIKKIFIKVKTEVTTIYNKNKNKTLKVIYTEIKKIIVPMYLKQKKLTMEFVDKKIARAKELIKEIQRKATEVIQKYSTLMRDVVLPELAKEAESIINQTLRAHVIMTKEVIKAYTSHAILVKKVLSKYVEIVKAKIPVLIAELRKYVEIVKAKIPVITAKVNKYIEIIKAEIPAIISKVEKYVKIAKAQIPFIKDTVKKMTTKITTAMDRMKDAIIYDIKVSVENFSRFLIDVKSYLERLTLREIINDVERAAYDAYHTITSITSDAIKEIIKLVDIIKREGLEKQLKKSIKIVIEVAVIIEMKLKEYFKYELVPYIENKINKIVLMVETNPTVLKIKAKLIALKKFALEEIENLKINPTVLKLKAELVELKKKILQKVEELKKNPTMLKIKEKTDRTQETDLTKSRRIQGKTDSTSEADFTES